MFEVLIAFFIIAAISGKGSPPPGETQYEREKREFWEKMSTIGGVLVGLVLLAGMATLGWWFVSWIYHLIFS